MSAVNVLVLTWTLVYAMNMGWGPPNPMKVSGFATEKACKDAAHKFMTYYPKPTWWLGHEEGWFANPGYTGIGCLDMGDDK